MQQAVDTVVTDTTPLRLGRAVQIAFPCGGMTVSGLRREASKGRLAVELIAGKQFTTLRDIQRMREQCRAPQKVLASGSNPKSETQKERSSAARPSSSETERAKSARAALEQTAKGLSKRSPNTSPENTKSRGTAVVIHLKS
jgi:hypothetical protein